MRSGATPVLDQVRDAIDERARLAGAGAGDDEQRPVPWAAPAYCSAFSSAAKVARWRDLAGAGRVDPRHGARATTGGRSFLGRVAELVDHPLLHVEAAVALFVPGVAAHVVAVALPESRLVLRQEFKAADPFGALPEVEVRNDAAAGASRGRGRAASRRGRRPAGCLVGRGRRAGGWW